MYEIVSVDQAINKGMKIVVIPTIAIIPVVMLFAVWLGQDTAYVKMYGCVGIAVGFLLAAIYWSFMSTRWRLWAFDNVRNVHELDKRATDHFIIGWAGLEKLEYQTATQKLRWAELQKKFYRADIFIEDFTVYDETVLPYSKIKALVNILLGAFFVLVAAYLYFDNEPGKNYKGVAVFSLLFGGWLIYDYSKKYNSTKLPIVLSNKGIEKSDGKFYSWDEIKGEGTSTKFHGETSNHYLVFGSPDGYQEIDIDDLSIRPEKLENLLRIYRGRFEHHQQRLRKRI